jgi:hypothetical protein
MAVSRLRSATREISSWFRSYSSVLASIQDQCKSAGGMEALRERCEKASAVAPLAKFAFAAYAKALSAWAKAVAEKGGAVALVMPDGIAVLERLWRAETMLAMSIVFAERLRKEPAPGTAGRKR